MKVNTNPPGYVPTEQESRAAYFKWLLKDMMEDRMMGLYMARKGKFKDNDESLESELNSIDRIFDKWYAEDGDQEVWESYYPYERFKEEWTSALSEEHSGDCTCAPAPCVRCHAEELYGLKSTVSWCRCDLYDVARPCSWCKK